MNELNYFTIDGAIGWNQDWFKEWWMNKGGCAAVTACDLCLYLAREKGLAALYPFDAAHPRKEDYLLFSDIMKPYLRPRWSGIDTLEIYLSGLSAYLADIGISCIKGTGLEGTAPWQEAADLIRRQIDAGIPVPCLLLHHKDPAFDDFQWHWFNLAGYEEFDGEFHVKAITYGTFFWMDLKALWDTGHSRKGGLIEITIEESGVGGKSPAKAQG